MPNPDRRLGDPLPSLEDMARLGSALLTFVDGDEALNSPIRRSAAVFRRARELAAGFKTQHAHLKIGGAYTEKGLQGAVGQLAQQTLEELAGLRDQPLAADRRALAELRTSMVVVDEPGDAGVAAMERQEIRAHLRLMSAGDPLRFYELARGALERGDETAAQAILRCPPVLRVLTDQQTAELAEFWSERRAPDKARLARRLQMAIDAAEAVLADAEAMVRKAAGMVDPDPIELIARGGIEALKPTGDRISEIARGERTL